MYCIEVYTNSFEDSQKVGIHPLPNFLAFDKVMKGIIKNTIISIDFTPVETGGTKLVCQLNNYLEFKLTRSKNSYSLKLLVSNKNLTRVNK